MTYTNTAQWFNTNNGEQNIFIHIFTVKTAALENLNKNHKTEYEKIKHQKKKYAANIKNLNI